MKAEAMILRWSEADIDKESVEAPKMPKPVFAEISTMPRESNDVVGQANNFRKTDEGLVCDLELQEKLTDTVVPAFTVKSKDKQRGITGFEIQSLGFTAFPEDKELKGNLEVGSDE